MPGTAKVISGSSAAPTTPACAIHLDRAPGREAASLAPTGCANPAHGLRRRGLFEKAASPATVVMHRHRLQRQCLPPAVRALPRGDPPPRGGRRRRPGRGRRAPCATASPMLRRHGAAAVARMIVDPPRLPAMTCSTPQSTSASATNTGAGLWIGADLRDIAGLRAGLAWITSACPTTRRPVRQLDAEGRSAAGAAGL